VSIRGQNAFAECDTVVVIGRNELGFKAAENLAMALTFDDAVEITRIEPDAAGHEGYGIERRPYLMRDGSKRSAKVSVHPDPIVQAIVEQKREGETLQALDRIRSVRSPQRKEFFHLCSIPLPDIEVDRLVSWKELAGNRKLNRILEIHAGPQLRALPLSSKWLAKRFPEVFVDAKAAENWLGYAQVAEMLKRSNYPENVNGYLLGNSGLFPDDPPPLGWLSSVWAGRLVEYRLAGRRGRWSKALVKDGHAPATAIAEALGVSAEDIIVRGAAPEAESAVKKRPWSKPTIAEEPLTPAEFSEVTEQPQLQPKRFWSEPHIVETENSLWPREVHIRLLFSAEPAPRCPPPMRLSFAAMLREDEGEGVLLTELACQSDWGPTHTLPQPAH
jgi:hypothetical protein